jgi:uncharacterized protein YndB with AHSA1/START domain
MTDLGNTGHVVAHSDFRAVRHLQLAPEQVFRAWAEETVKRSWFAPEAEHYELDFRPGGGEVVDTALADGHRVRFAATYHDILPAERLVFSAVLSSDGRPATVSVTSVEFETSAGGCDLTLVEQGVFLDGLEQPDWRRRGTEDWLDSLVRHLSEGTR